GPHFAHFRRGKATQPSVFPHRRLALGEIDTEGLVVDHVGMLPLAFAPELGQRAVGGCRGVPELRPVHGADTWQVAFDHVAFHFRYSGWIACVWKIGSRAAAGQMSLMTI